MNQQELNDICDGLDIHYDVLDNISCGKCYFKACITFTNNSSTTLTHEQHWSLYFSHLHGLEPDFLIDADEFIYVKQGLRLQQLNGDLHCLSPTKDFNDLCPGMTLTLPVTSEACSVSRNDHFPNWYLCAGERTEARVVQSTVGEALQYVGAFDVPRKWKRYDYKKCDGERVVDLHDPPTPLSEYEINRTRSGAGGRKWSVLPTPRVMTLDEGTTMAFNREGWTVCCESKRFIAEAEFLSVLLKLRLSDKHESPNTIVLRHGKTDPGSSHCESYKLRCDTHARTVTIESSTAAGAFYGAQTLASLCAAGSGTLPEVDIIDFPRYGYRGMHLDVARNFHSKEEVLRLIDAMAMYKLNNLHLHLSDDEGWRIEIPGLEELTSVSSKRGHDLSERTCLMPYLGSGPSVDVGSGSGYYSKRDYREILVYATQRHVEVIPEIDLPGHAHAAINAMQVRYDRLMAAQRPTDASQYLLLNQSDISTELSAASVQNFHSNAVDPTLESTYAFIEKVVETFIRYHSDIAPLKAFHIGGDEVPYAAWGTYRKCEALLEKEEITMFLDLMEMFMARTSCILAKHDLCFAVWQDGLLVSSKRGNIEREKIKCDHCWVYAWRNRYNMVDGGCAYKLANNGYKVIQCEGSHLYFDHPQSPHPEDPGLYWAARYIDTYKVFSLTPDDLIGCHDVNLSGAEFTKADKKEAREMWSKLEKPENIIGMQGQLWSELVRSPSRLHLMIFPRLVALAERAWHKASWEDIHDRRSRESSKLADWSSFASNIGTKELSRLDEMGVCYHLPMPGARIKNKQLEMNSCYPGLPNQYSVDDGHSWLDYVNPVALDNGQFVLVRSCMKLWRGAMMRVVTRVYK